MYIYDIPMISLPEKISYTCLQYKNNLNSTIYNNKNFNNLNIHDGKMDN